MSKFYLDESQRIEILKMRFDLEKNYKNFKNFKSFKQAYDEAFQLCDAMLKNDYNYFKKCCLKYTTHKAKKMQGILSLSTYKKTCAICNYLSQHDGAICKKCYAEKSLNLYAGSLLPCMIYNTLLLKYFDLETDQIPYINAKYFRLESFSDLQSAKHLKNLIKVCKKNKHVLFTLWSKAGYTLVKMMHDENIKKLPSNLNIVVSSIYINKSFDMDYLNGLQSVLNTSNKLKCFTVYDDESKQNASGQYICKNACATCLKCYKKSKNIIYIAEKIH